VRHFRWGRSRRRADLVDVCDHDARKPPTEFSLIFSPLPLKRSEVTSDWVVWHGVDIVGDGQVREHVSCKPGAYLGGER
jgi:hypothetical protein